VSEIEEIDASQIDMGSFSKFGEELLYRDLYETFFEALEKEEKYDPKGKRKLPLLSMTSNGDYYVNRMISRGDKYLPGKPKFFSSGRDLAKHLIFLYLFQVSPKSKPFGQGVFKKHYPGVYSFLISLKAHFKSNYSGKTKMNLPILLQNIESSLILDCVTKRIARKYPEMPLFTIHDSIATTQSLAPVLEKEMYSFLKECVPVLPQIVRENW
jgi:hypothetical protein